MSANLDNAINAVNGSQQSFCRYITANDVGATGSHQSGFYIPKDSWQLLFDTPGVKGSNKERMVKITWNGDITTDSRAIYYGAGTRNEYRLTRFGRGFPLLDERYSGSLLVIAKMDNDEYQAFILETDSDIDDFRAFFDIEPSAGHLIDSCRDYREVRFEKALSEILNENSAFPSTQLMSSLARALADKAAGEGDNWAVKDPDTAITTWIDAEYKLFKAFEEREFEIRGRSSFDNCQALIDYSNSLLNRRKARAGKSLEHHLAHIFTLSKIAFEAQAVTEANKRPDFIFPDAEAYHNLLFPADGLTFLGAKTTCKDRWRQVLNEADRIPHKYLFTLQPGISVNQLDEMTAEHLTLVVPKSNVSTFAPSHREKLLTLDGFISHVRVKQSRYC